MSKKDLEMIFSMLVKLSNSVKEYEVDNFDYGWDKHSAEREYFEKRLKELKAKENEE